jgi:hypothetical protein
MAEEQLFSQYYLSGFYGLNDCAYWRDVVLSRARICKPRDRFLAWRVGTIILFDVLARQAT